MKRSRTRIYRISESKYVEIVKEYSLKFGQNLYYVFSWGETPQLTLLKVPTFAEARQFVRDLAAKG